MLFQLFYVHWKMYDIQWNNLDCVLGIIGYSLLYLNLGITIIIFSIIVISKILCVFMKTPVSQNVGEIYYFWKLFFITEIQNTLSNYACLINLKFLFILISVISVCLISRRKIFPDCNFLSSGNLLFENLISKLYVIQNDYFQLFHMFTF